MRPRREDQSTPQGQPAPAFSSRETQQGKAASRRWPAWALWFALAAFSFIAFECVLLAVVLKGPWLILLAPGIVCAVKAWETWRELRQSDQSAS